MKLKIGILVTFVLIFPNSFFGQKALYPKDTIYIEFDNSIKDGYNKKSLVDIQDISGIRFNISTTSGRVTVFYSGQEPLDTVSLIDVSKYRIVDRKEIIRLHNLWIENPDSNNPRPPADRNGAFETFVLEKISSGGFLKYPVTWYYLDATD